MQRTALLTVGKSVLFSALALAFGTDNRQFAPQPTTAATTEAVVKIADASELAARTDEERVRAQYYSTGQPKVLDLLKMGVARGGPYPESGGLIPGGFRDTRTEDEKTRDWLCRFSEVVVGRPLSRTVRLSEDEGSLFTDYLVDAGTWLRGSLGSPARLIVSRLGGEVQIGDRTLYDGSGGSQPSLGTASVFLGRRISTTSSIDLTHFLLIGTKVDGLDLPADSSAYVQSLIRGAALCR